MAAVFLCVVKHGIFWALGLLLTVLSSDIPSNESRMNECCKEQCSRKDIHSTKHHLLVRGPTWILPTFLVTQMYLISIQPASSQCKEHFISWRSPLQRLATTVWMPHCNITFCYGHKVFIIPATIMVHRH